MPKEKVKSPNDDVRIFVNSNDVFTQLGQQFVVYQIDDHTYRVPIGQLVTTKRFIAEVALTAGDITQIIE